MSTRRKTDEVRLYGMMCYCFLPITLFAVIVAFCSGPAQAQTTQYASGIFAWGTDSKWATTSAATYDQPWISGNDAVFEGAAGTVSIAPAGVTARNLFFTNVTGYIIQSNTLTLNGTTPTITVGTNLSATITAIIAGSVGLTKSGDGTLRLTGVNNYTGGTFVNGGTISINGAGAVNNQNITLNGGTFAPDGYTTPPQITVGPNGGTILNSGGWQSWNNDITGSGNCYYYNTGTDDRLARGAGYSLSGDFVVMANPPGQAKISSLPNSTLNITAATIGLNTANPVFGGLTGSQNLNLGAFVVQIGNNNKDTTYTGILSGGSVTKIGTGTLMLTGANTFSGQLTIQSGTLAVSNINNSSTSGPMGQSASAVILGCTGGVTGALRMMGSSATYTTTNRFTMAAGGTGAFQIENAGTTQTISGVIDGSGSLMKTGSGTLLLTATNTYSGNTTISNGILGISSACLSSTSSVYIAKDAIFALNFTGTATICSLYLNDEAQTPDNYGASASFSSYFSGSGKLFVTNGPPASGTVITVR